MENIKKLLINGGAGYIGSNTINTLFYLIFIYERIRPNKAFRFFTRK